MRCSLFATELLLATSVSAILEIPVVKRDRDTAGRTAHRARGLLRRRGTLETTLFSGIGYVSGGAYYANISIGTPGQALTVLLDTGSSDLYVDVGSDCPSSSSNHPCLGGTFDPSASSTLQVLPGNDAFNASYGDGSTAIGPYALDTVQIGDIAIEDVQFGLAETIHATVGPATSLMGVGSYVIEATKQKYPNIPWVLADAGIIDSRLFSLYLNSYDDLTGSILFGGIDTEKYTGDLVTTDTLPDPVTGYVDQYITAITALKASVGGNSQTIFSGGSPGAQAYKSGSSLPVLLDSGSSAWSVPPRIYEAIVSQFSYVDAKTGVGSCKYTTSGDSVTLTVNDQIDITVDISEFFLPLYDPSNNKPEYISQDEQACGFSIVPSEGTGEGFDVMGDAMLRSMYIVYDQDLGQLSIAQAKPGAATSNIIAVQAGAGGVAKAAGSSGKNTGANSYSIAPSQSISGSIAYSTAKSTIGTATGLAAIPTAARVSGEAAASASSSGSGSGSGSGSNHSHGAAATVLPPIRWGGLGSAAAAVAMMCLGAAFVL